MHDGGADLALDVVADDGKSALLEAPAPFGIGGDEDRDAVHEGAARFQSALRIPFGCLLRSYRQVGHENIRAGLTQDLGDVGLVLRRFVDLVAQVLAQAVEGPAAVNHNPTFRHGREALRVVGLRENRFGNVAADL
jgi:hypothetical protein